MKAAFLISKNTFTCLEAPVPVLSEGEALVKVSVCGFCGSDVHDAANAIAGAAPRTPGHEFAGIVEEIRGESRGFAPGDEVVISPLIACGTCNHCLAGREHLCSTRGVIGCQTPGGFAQRVKVPTANLVHLPQGLTMAEATLADPLAVVLHAFDLAGEVAGKSILIFGARTLGLFAVQVAKLRGAASVVVVDLVEPRLALAKKLGAGNVVNAGVDPDLETLKNTWFDVCIELAGGRAPTLVKAIQKTHSGGLILLVAQRSPTEIPCATLQGSELRLQGVFGQTYKNFLQALDLLASGKINGKALLTDTYPLEQMQAAFDHVSTPESVKVLVTPNS